MIFSQCSKLLQNSFFNQDICITSKFRVTSETTSFITNCLNQKYNDLLFFFVYKTFLPTNNHNIDCKYANGVGLPFKQHMHDSVSLSEREELREREHRRRSTVYQRRDASIFYAPGLVAREQASPWPTLKIEFDGFVTSKWHQKCQRIADISLTKGSFTVLMTST